MIITKKAPSGAKNASLVTSAGIEPALPGWKPGVLTVILRGHDSILTKVRDLVNFIA